MNTVPFHLVSLMGSLWSFSVASPESMTLPLIGVVLAFVMYIRAQVIEFNKFIREERNRREAMIQAALVANGRILL
tara:strand:- start:12210 stop:12437 length:228 start_codon:yes stop_codon:yes gene_type:complete